MRSRLAGRAILLGIGVAVIYWVFEAFMDSVLGHQNFAAMLIPRDANELWMRLTVVTLIVAFSGYLHTTHRRRVIEEALRASETQVRAIFDKAGIGMALGAMDGRIVQSNPALQKLLGYTAEELHRNGVVAATYPDDLAADMSLFGELVDGKRDQYQIEKRYVRKDGKLIWGNLTVSLIRDAASRPEYIVAMVQDITARKRVEEALGESEERLSAILNNTTAVVYVKDTEGRFEFVNRRFEELFHVSQEQARGKLDRDLFPRDTADAFRSNDLKVLESGEPLEMEEVVPQDDGMHTYISIKFPLRNAAGEVYAICGVSTDITRRKRAEEERDHALAELERAVEFRDRFLSIASHELRTPITLLKGYTELLYQQAQQDAYTSMLRPLETLNRQANRMARLVNDLSDVSRIERDQIDLEMCPLDLNAAVEEVVQEVAAGSPGFVLNFERQASGLRVCGDRARLQQVVTNLLSNAVRYSGPRKELDVDIRREADRAVVCVRDYGIGIPQDERCSVFDLYFRGTNAQTSSRAGLGLGLFISRAIVERHGGEIGVESREGEGSTFWFSVPLADSQDS